MHSPVGTTREPGAHTSEALAFVSELVRLIAPPAGEEEICARGLGLTARTLGASAGTLLLRDVPSLPLRVAASVGAHVACDVLRMGEEILSGAGTLQRQAPEAGPTYCLALPLTDRAGQMGALVLQALDPWGEDHRDMASAATLALAVSLRSARLLREARSQKEMLARRNLELEALRELAGRLQGFGSEHEMLSATLDLVLEKLGLKAGWIFWGAVGPARLQLAACRGVDKEAISGTHEPILGECPCLDVFDSERLVTARNTTDCPRVPELLKKSGAGVHACVPLKLERGVLGVMNIVNLPGRLFTPEELAFLETVGHQLCLAVDKARSAVAESRRNSEARVLASLAHAIGGSLDQNRVMEAVGEYSRKLLGADRCVIFLSEGTAALRFTHLAGPPVAGLKPGDPADFGAAGMAAVSEALLQRRAVVVANVGEQWGTGSLGARLWGSGSLLLVPLISQERLEGLLAAGRAEPSTWSQDQIELADALAGQAALAIENARLYREAREAFLRLQQAQYGMMRAERLAAVGMLASSLAHEVRNPLNSISLQLVLLSRRVARVADPVGGDLSALVETARREIARLDGLVEEFLTLSSIDRISLAEADPAEVVREVTALLAPVARESGILVVESLDGVNQPLLIDREKIKQVLINLIRNAIEAMPQGGRLTITGASSDESLVIGVQDTGTGIEPGLDVFDFFVTTKRGGTGLGLSIARRIVEAHGGSLTYSSEPGRGTTFEIRLNRDH